MKFRLDPTRTDVNEVHNEICVRAAEIANADELKHKDFFFHPLAVASSRTRPGIDGFMLEWDPDHGTLQQYSLEDQQWIQYHMDSIGREAIQKAIQEKAHLLVGLILGEARQGRNYFDHFQTDDASTNTN